MTVDALYASIGERLARVAAANRANEWQLQRLDRNELSLLASAEASVAMVASQSREAWSRATRPPAITFTAPGQPIALDACASAQAGTESSASRSAKPSIRLSPLWGGAGLLALATLAIAALLLAEGAPRPDRVAREPAAQSPVAAALRPAAQRGVTPPAVSAAPVIAAAPAVAVAAPERPRLEIVTGSSTDERMTSDLLRLVAPASGLDLHRLPTDGWSESLAELQGGPRLALVRYDALQAARGANAGAGPGALRVVTALYTEELHFVTRRDSPLRYVHEIEGARINIGPARGGRALTASTLYERMFGKPMIGFESSRLDEESALAALLSGGAIDVMVVVGAQPAARLADLGPAQASALKLLEFDRNHATSRAALRSFLPGAVQPSSYPGWLGKQTPTLAVMSFLVAAAGQADGERVGLFAKELCRNLPALQRDGHPKWREVHPGLQLDAGWPYASAATEAFRNCQPQPQLTSAKGVRP